MSNKTTTENAKSEPSAPLLRADSLAAGVVFMLSVAVIQRMMGFARSALFCNFLEQDELGQWSLAFGFLLLAAPLAVLGLPGSFGRYVEYYRSRGQLHAFLRRTTFSTIALSLCAVTAICLGRRWFAWMIFNDANQSDFILILGLALVAVIAFNFLVELMTALRQVRVATLMQFVNSFVFASLGLTLVYFTSLGATAAAIAYGVGCFVAALAVLPWVRRCWRDSAAATAEPLAHRQLWAKLLPFAGWVWVMNLVANLFAAADRWMILHFAPLDAEAAQALVGQYHSSRVIPVVLIGVAGMLSSVLLPYLSHDWEIGRKEQVARRLNLTLKLVALSFTVIATVILLLAPLLFNWFLQGRYNDGLVILPWTLVYCIWFSLILLAQNYLWCAEKTKLSSLVLSIGLVVNIVLNCVLLPIFGLLGAVLATAAANAISFIMIYLLNGQLGMRLERSVWMAVCLPLFLVLGPSSAAAAILLVLLAALWGDWLFQEHEKRQLQKLVTHYIEKALALTKKRKPASA